MDRLELKPKAKLTLNVGGVDYALTRPTVGAAIELEEAIEKAGEKKGGIRIIRDFIVTCGLPENIVKGLDAEDLKAVSEFLMPTKKN